MTDTRESARFFYGLDGLRAIAAFSVVIHHVADLLTIYGYKNIGIFQRFFLPGYDDVVCFFVLSGFLITYQLLQQQEKQGVIQFKGFYLRRILRICPLYFLIIFISSLIYLFLKEHIPPSLIQHHPLKSFLLLVFFLPNIAVATDNPILGSGPLWSLGIELQFYLLWPLLIKYFKSHMIIMMISVFILQWLYSIVTTCLVSLGYHNACLDLLAQGRYIFPYGNMAVGGISAWLIYTKRNKILQIIYHPVMQLIAYTAICFFIYIQNWFSGAVHPLFEKFIMGIMPCIFMIIVLNISSNTKSLLLLRNSFLNYLGKISYGIYMFHSTVIFMMINIYSSYHWQHFEFITLIYLSTILVTIIIAAMSFHTFEAYFLQFKRKKLPTTQLSYIPRMNEL